MSIFATNYTIDEITGEVKLIKRLNKIRIDRKTARKQPGGYGKSGNKARLNKVHNYTRKTRVFGKNLIKEKLNEE